MKDLTEEILNLNSMLKKKNDSMLKNAQKLMIDIDKKNLQILKIQKEKFNTIKEEEYKKLEDEIKIINLKEKEEFLRFEQEFADRNIALHVEDVFLGIKEDICTKMRFCDD